MTRKDIHEAAKDDNDKRDGGKPGGHGEVSEASQVKATGADAVPENTTGVHDQKTPDQPE